MTKISLRLANYLFCLTHSVVLVNRLKPSTKLIGWAEMYRHLKSKTSENTYLSITINFVNQTNNSNGSQRKNRGKFNVQPIYSYLLRETNTNRTQIDLDLFVVISVRLKPPIPHTSCSLFLERNLNPCEDVLASPPCAT